MTPLVAISRPKAPLISQVMLLVLLVWWAIPEVPSPKLSFDTKLSQHCTDEILVQFETVKVGAINVSPKNVSTFIPAACVASFFAKAIIHARVYFDINAFLLNKTMAVGLENLA